VNLVGQQGREVVGKLNIKTGGDMDGNK